MMVFTDDRFNGTHKIITYGSYRPVWNDKAAGIRNRRNDFFSNHILDLKKRNPLTIILFASLLEIEINEGISICVVPSSNPDFVNTGIALLGK